MKNLNEILKENWTLAIKPDTLWYKVPKEMKEQFDAEWEKINALCKKEQPVLSEEERQENYKNIVYVLNAWFS